MTRTIEVIRRGRRGPPGTGFVSVETVTGDRTLTDSDTGKVFRVTANATLTIPATVSEAWSIIVDPVGGDATLSTTATINGGSSLVLAGGNAAQVYSAGSAHYAKFFSASQITALGADDVAFTPITGNAGTTVAGAIGILTGLWSAVTAYGKSLIAAADAAAARTVLGLGGLATLDILDEDDMASDSAVRPPSQQSVKAFAESLRDPVQTVAYGVLNGTGTPAFTFQTGFSASVTDNGAGDYSVTFDAAEPDANYGVTITADAGGAAHSVGYDTIATTGFDIIALDSAGSGVDLASITIKVERVRA